MPLDVWWSLCVVCYLLFVDRCLLIVGCRLLLFGGYHVMCVVCGVLIIR